LDEPVQVTDRSPCRAELSRRPIRGKGMVNINSKARHGVLPDGCLGRFTSVSKRNEPTRSQPPDQTGRRPSCALSRPPLKARAPGAQCP
jgi:hypothetical protein